MKRISEQVVVITGGSSGIGRETALRFGAKGASVVIAARSEEALYEVADQIVSAGGNAHAVVCDVSTADEVDRLADTAVRVFGRIDTWVNNAAVEEWAAFEDHDAAEMERIIRINLLGTMFGTQAALRVMRAADEGSIINVGSVESKRPLPLQSVYSASKHGVKAFTQVLRMELANEKSGIGVTLILPASINTPLVEHAVSKIGSEPRPAPPVYDPAVVAEAILFASEHPRDEIVVGGAGKLLTLMERLAPRTADRLMVAGGSMFKAQKSMRPAQPGGNLFTPSRAPRVRGRYPGHRTSIYTRVFEQHPVARRVVLGGMMIGAAAWLMRKRQTD